jgi:hypothetical protein
MAMGGRTMGGRTIEFMAMGGKTMGFLTQRSGYQKAGEAPICRMSVSLGTKTLEGPRA